MTIFEAYQQAVKKLQNPELEEINIRILLCENNGLKNMSEFYIRKDENVLDLQRFNQDLQRFLSGEPVQYITQKATFLDHDFYVSRDVLIPRNETEEVVVFAAKTINRMFGKKKVNIADVCTGSGCIGLALSTMVKANCLYLSDISQKALNVAKINAKNFKQKAILKCGDALEWVVNEKIDVIVSNPPYILNKKDVDERVLKYEPHNALFVDENLTIYRKIISRANELKVPLIIFEIGYDLVDKLSHVINEITSNYKVEFINDINKLPRICILTRV